MTVKLLQLPTFFLPLSLIKRIIKVLRQKQKKSFLITACFALMGFFPSYAQDCNPLQASSGFQCKVQSKYGNRSQTVTGSVTSLHTLTTNQQKLVDEQGNDIGVVSVNVYPNPAARDLTIDMQFSNVAINACTIEVRNLVGQVVKSEQPSIVDSHMYHQISFQDLMPNGMYMIGVIAGESRFNEQFIIHND